MSRDQSTYYEMPGTSPRCTSTPESVYECSTCDYDQDHYCERCYEKGSQIYIFCNRSRLAVTDRNAASSACRSEIVDEILDNAPAKPRAHQDKRGGHLAERLKEREFQLRMAEEFASMSEEQDKQEPRAKFERKIWTWLDSLEDASGSEDLDECDELHQIWTRIGKAATEVARLSRQVLTSAEWEPFRLAVEEAIEHHHITQAVCLGLASAFGSSSDGNNHTLRELAIFLAVVEMVSKGQAPPADHDTKPWEGRVPVILQEPCFRLLDKMLLTSLGSEVVEQPTARHIIDEGTLVFAKCLPIPLTFDYVMERKEVAVWFGNDLASIAARAVHLSRSSKRTLQRAYDVMRKSNFPTIPRLFLDKEEHFKPPHNTVWWRKPGSPEELEKESPRPGQSLEDIRAECRAIRDSVPRPHSSHTRGRRWQKPSRISSVWVSGEEQGCLCG